MKIKIYSTSLTPLKVSLHTQHILHTTLIVINQHKQKSSITVQSNNSNRICHVMSLPRSVCYCFGHGPVPHSPTTHTQPPHGLVAAVNTAPQSRALPVLVACTECTPARSPTTVPCLAAGARAALRVKNRNARRLKVGPTASQTCHCH